MLYFSFEEISPKIFEFELLSKEIAQKLYDLNNCGVLILMSSELRFEFGANSSESRFVTPIGRHLFGARPVFYVILLRKKRSHKMIFFYLLCARPKIMCRPKKNSAPGHLSTLPNT